MEVEGLGKILAVGFDIDGTLYRQWKLHFLMFMHFLRYCQFFLRYGLARARLHKMPFLADFRGEQAKLMARLIGFGCTPERAAARLERIAYSGLSKFFDKMTPCDAVEETFRLLCEAGVKIALLSDFPPEQKGGLWGLKKYAAVTLGTENIGALKPSPVPFRVMAKMLEVDAKNILFVGNSAKYDIRGAKAAGMKTAHFESVFCHLLHLHIKDADISFAFYKQLIDRLGLISKNC